MHDEAPEGARLCLETTASDSRGNCHCPQADEASGADGSEADQRSGPVPCRRGRDLLSHIADSYFEVYGKPLGPAGAEYVLGLVSWPASGVW